jgi:hypothetical protein
MEKPKTSAADELEDALSTSQLIRILEEETAPKGPHPGDTVTMRPVPRITRMPEGIEVVEGRIGRATAQWVVQVRCECGRRWFEVEVVKSATCPRCSTLVLIEMSDDE